MMEEKTKNKGQWADLSGYKSPGRIILLFALASFYFLTVDVVLNDTTARLLGQEKIIPLYALAMLSLAAGFALFSYLHRAARTAGRRRAMLALVFFLSALGLWGFVLAGNPAFFVTMTVINMLATGVIGGAVHYYAAMDLRDRAYTGRVIGMAIGLEAFLQVLVLMSLTSARTRAAVLSAALFAAFYMVIRKTPAALTVFPKGSTKKVDSPSRNYILFITAIVAVISLMGGLDDGIVTYMDTRHIVNLYAFPRVLYLVGVIAAGFIADVQDRRYLPVVVLFIMICSTGGVMFLNNPSTFMINACIYSLFAGFAIMYFTVTFFDLALSMSNPMLWAGMGRIIRFVFIAIGAISSGYVFTSWNFNYIIVLYIFLSALLMLLFYLSYITTSGAAIGEAEPVVPDAQADMLQRAKNYNLTGRESQVLECLLNNMQTAEIAQALYISERTVKFHLSNIFKKTGTSKRTELLLVLNQNNPQPPISF